MRRSHVIDHLTRHHDQEHIGLCFAYFSFQDPSFQDIVGLVPALLKQLCRGRNAIPSLLTKVKQEAGDAATVANSDAFSKVVETYEQVFVVIDGLDECPGDQRSPILNFILEVTSVPSSCVKFFVMSRREHDISSHFRGLNTPIVEVETGKVIMDIQKFVSDEATRLRNASYGIKLCVSSDDLFQEIVRTLTKKSDGMQVMYPLCQYIN